MPQLTVARRCAPMAFQALVIIAAATPLRAQVVEDSVLVIVGDRIRASTADTTVIGRVTRLTNQGFELGQGQMRRSFAYRELEGLEVSRGPQSRWAEGVVFGVAAGAIVGLTQADVPGGTLGEAVCVIAGWAVVPWWCFGDFLEKALVAGAIGGATGLVIGALIKHEAWESIPLADDRVSFSPILAPQRDLGGHFGVVLGGRVTF